MRSTIWISLVFFSFACGDDSTGGGGAGGDAVASTAASAGDGGGPTTTGAGGILDDGTEATIEACEAFQAAAATAASDIPDCAGDSYPPCTESAPGWVPCVAEWKAFYECAAPVTTAERCQCDDLGDGTDLVCSYDEDCPEESAALADCTL